MMRHDSAPPVQAPSNVMPLTAGRVRRGSDRITVPRFEPERGVIDRDCRVFGVDNPFLSGACTFTAPGTANPTNLVVAITLRLADHLIAERDRAQG